MTGRHLGFQSLPCWNKGAAALETTRGGQRYRGVGDGGHAAGVVGLTWMGPHAAGLETETRCVRWRRGS